MRSPRRIGVGGWFLRAYAAGFGAVFGVCSAICVGGLFFLVLTSAGTMLLSGGSPIEIDLSGNNYSPVPGSTTLPSPYGSVSPPQPMGESVRAAQYEAAMMPPPAGYGGYGAAPYPNPNATPYPSTPAVQNLPPALSPTTEVPPEPIEPIASPATASGPEASPVAPPQAPPIESAPNDSEVTAPVPADIPTAPDSAEPNSDVIPAGLPSDDNA